MSSETTPAAAPVDILACKYDGRLHRRWTARLARREDSLLVFEGVFDEEINHPLLGRIVPGTLSTEYYWTDRFYSIFRFAEPDVRLRNFYCNVNLPPRFDGRELSFVDLDMDVLVAPDFSYRVLDEDEFEANSARYGYTAEVRAQAHASLAELILLIAERGFPFSLEA